MVGSKFGVLGWFSACGCRRWCCCSQPAFSVFSLDQLFWVGFSRMWICVRVPSIHYPVCVCVCVCVCVIKVCGLLAFPDGDAKVWV